MLSKNQPTPKIIATAINGEYIDLYSLRGKKILIKFHRFSGCPVARHQLNEFIERQNELNAAGTETIVFLHSSPQKILSTFKEVSGLHFIADKQKKFYKNFHSQFLFSKLFSIASWKATFTAIFKGYFPLVNKFEGGIIGIPSDFLIDENGMVADLHYGKHFGDSWTVSDVLKKLN